VNNHWWERNFPPGGLHPVNPELRTPSRPAVYEAFLPFFEFVQLKLPGMNKIEQHG
jgi:hypothetical protein